jgi:hypothetical protein
MSKARCPRCKCYMFTDYKLGLTWCMHCDYNKPNNEDILWAKVSANIIK